MSYAVKAIFDTIQGEGARAGTQAVFVRFAGCNLWSGRPEDRQKGKGACARWCDTDFVVGEKLAAATVLARMDALVVGSDRWCVLTGGEPALQLDLPLVSALRNAGWGIAVETNGTVDSEAMHAADWVTVSPKKGGAVRLRAGNELKVVLPGAVGDEQGWTDAQLDELAGLRLWPFMFVQPMDPPLSAAVEDTYLHPQRSEASGASQRVYASALERCLSFVRSRPSWRLGAQLHKVWRLP